jgi:hypothetical protein
MKNLVPQLEVELQQLCETKEELERKNNEQIQNLKKNSDLVKIKQYILKLHDCMKN